LNITNLIKPSKLHQTHKITMSAENKQSDLAYEQFIRESYSNARFAYNAAILRAQEVYSVRPFTESPDYVQRYKEARRNLQIAKDTLRIARLNYENMFRR
jgi:hypothetical protein